MNVSSAPLAGWPALVLNADFRPLSYYPLSLWPWQEVVKAVFLERVDVVAHYDQVVHSPSFEMKLPIGDLAPRLRAPGSPAGVHAVQRVPARRLRLPVLRLADDLTFDHVVPRSKGGRTTWENIVTACAPCNLRKGGKYAHHTGMRPHRRPRRPTMHELQHIGRRFPPHHLHESWMDYLYWDVELEA